MKSVSERNSVLFVCDLLAIFAAYAFGIYLRDGYFGFGILKYGFLYFSLIAFPVLFYIFDLYYTFRRFAPAQTFVDVSLSVFLGTVVAAAVAYADRTFILPRTTFVYTMVLLIIFIYTIRRIYDSLFQSHLLDKRAVILGTGPLAMEIARIIKETPHSGMEVIGLVHEGRKGGTGTKNGIPIVGGMSDLISLVDWYNVQLVIMAIDPSDDAPEARIMADIVERRLNVTSAIHLFEKLTGDVPYKLLGSHYLLGLMSQVKSRPYLKLKRLMDFSFAGLLFLLLLPVLSAAILLLWLTGTRKIFFFQERVGRNGVRFRLIKLRSMSEKRKGKPEVTGIGRWIRRYRIDEIPQLVNVLKGDMSLIGPRPDIPHSVELCRKKIPFYDAIFSLKPGLTGWAQVRFGHTISFKDSDRKFRYNLYYLKNISLALDLLIFLKTIRVVLLGKGK